jgi:restriction endonuclease S subunit
MSTFLINLVGASIGRSCRVKDDLGPANINQAVAVFRLRDSRSAPYVEYFFQSPATIERILEMQADAARPNISLGNLRSFIVALPPLPEQNAIAAALSDVDALLGALDGLIAKKRTVKQAAMRQLLTGQARLPGFSSKWETKRLGDHVTFLRNGTHARAELDETGPLREQGAIAEVLSDMDAELAALEAAPRQDPPAQAGHDAGAAHRKDAPGMSAIGDGREADPAAGGPLFVDELGYEHLGNLADGDNRNIIEAAARAVPDDVPTATTSTRTARSSSAAPSPRS